MGESILSASNYEDKMGKTTASNPALEVSVSFGRFEHDSLSWEKWSTFSPNKYLEEVEKCATPGSVAMKKAYFEAHYRKIAARKAEQQDEVKQVEHYSLRSNEDNKVDLIGETNGTDTKMLESIDQISAKEVSEGTRVENESSDGYIDDNMEEDFAVNTEGEELATGEVREEFDRVLDGHALYKPEEASVTNKEELPHLVPQEAEKLLNLEVENDLKESALVVKEETPSLGNQESKELAKKLERKVERIPMVKKGMAKSHKPKDSQKIASMRNIREVATVKKKPVLPASKMPHISTPKVSRPVSVSTALTTSQSTKKTSSSIPRNRTPASGESKKVASKSLHMSLSLDTPDAPSSHPAPLTVPPRKSLIMEKMKDKDIVKRAFKTFQNNLNQFKSPTEEKAFGMKETPSRETEFKVSTSGIPRKENGGTRIVGAMDKKTAKAAPSSFIMERDEMEGRRLSLDLGTLKRLEGKSIAKTAESTHDQGKLKERKDAEIKKLRQSLNFKATPIPGFYRVQKISKSPSDKVGAKAFGM